MVEKMKSADFPLLDCVFGMSGGYVMNFSDKTFSEFFYDDLGVDIDDPKYTVEGASKAKRLRCYLKSSSVTEQVRVLTALWGYRARLQRLSGEGEPSPAYAVDELAPSISGHGVVFR